MDRKVENLIDQIFVVVACALVAMLVVIDTIGMVAQR
jgi:hypothetical protein